MGTRLIALLFVTCIAFNCAKNSGTEGTNTSSTGILGIQYHDSMWNGINPLPIDVTCTISTELLSSVKEVKIVQDHEGVGHYEIEYTLLDNGLNEDGAANDGVFGKKFAQDLNKNPLWYTNNANHSLKCILTLTSGAKSFLKKETNPCCSSTTGTETEPANVMAHYTISTGRVMWRKCAIGQSGISCNSTGSAPEYGAQKFAYCSSGSCTDGTILNGSGTSPAYQACNSLNSSAYAGFSNWRAPRISELQSLIDTNFPQRISTNLFPNFMHNGVNFTGSWSAEVVAGNQGVSALFYSGGLSYGGQIATDLRYMYCVRTIN